MGGYDSGYDSCPCFWGREPGTFVRYLVENLTDVKGLSVLDAGCGEGKNAAYLAQNGARVLAIDISESAIRNGRQAFGDVPNLHWQVGDIRTIKWPTGMFDIVVAYGLLHCLQSVGEVSATVELLKMATRANGYHVICCFNGRLRNLEAHPDLAPVWLQHEHIVSLYADWDLLRASDTDLIESHPHNRILHTHSLTRMIARRLS